jgi:hypothetical protein
MECESMPVHCDFEQLPGCDEGIGLAKKFLIECRMAVYNMSIDGPTDERFDFLCKYNALVRHRASCLECKEAGTNRQSSLMTSRDAVIRFECSKPDFVEVSETDLMGGSIHHQKVQRHPDVVTAIEERYIFFAQEAEIAKKQVMRGHSCVFNVYFREP